jgi:hypothetical protein
VHCPLPSTKMLVRACEICVQTAGQLPSAGYAAGVALGACAAGRAVVRVAAEANARLDESFIMIWTGLRNIPKYEIREERLAPANNERVR